MQCIYLKSPQEQFFAPSDCIVVYHLFLLVKQTIEVFMELLQNNSACKIDLISIQDILKSRKISRNATSRNPVVRRNQV